MIHKTTSPPQFPRTPLESVKKRSIQTGNRFKGGAGDSQSRPHAEEMEHFGLLYFVTLPMLMLSSSHHNHFPAAQAAAAGSVRLTRVPAFPGCNAPYFFGFSPVIVRGYHDPREFGFGSVPGNPQALLQPTISPILQPSLAAHSFLHRVPSPGNMLTQTRPELMEFLAHMTFRPFERQPPNPSSPWFRDIMLGKWNAFHREATPRSFVDNSSLDFIPQYLKDIFRRFEAYAHRSGGFEADHNVWPVMLVLLRRFLSRRVDEAETAYMRVVVLEALATVLEHETEEVSIVDCGPPPKPAGEEPQREEQYPRTPSGTGTEQSPRFVLLTTPEPRRVERSFVTPPSRRASVFHPPQRTSKTSLLGPSREDLSEKTPRDEGKRRPLDEEQLPFPLDERLLSLPFSTLLGQHKKSLSDAGDRDSDADAATRLPSPTESESLPFSAPTSIESSYPQSLGTPSTARSRDGRSPLGLLMSSPKASDGGSPLPLIPDIVSEEISPSSRARQRQEPQTGLHPRSFWKLSMRTDCILLKSIHSRVWGGGRC